jgi:tetratricopeptide (TPR) repeat protein
LNSVDKADNKSLKPYKSAFTCVTCHNPHMDVRSVSDNSFNTICQNCHGKKVTQVCTGNMEERKKVDDNCVSCHMPKGKTMDIPHVLTTDHYIRIPSEKVDKEKVKKFITLYDVNNPNPSNYTKGVAFIQQFARFESDFPLLLDSAKHYFSDATPQDVRRNFSPLIDIAFYRQDYPSLLNYVGALHPQFVLDSILTHKDYTNADAWSAYRIGEAFFQINNDRGAEAFYERAVKLAPYVLEFQNKLGASLVQLKRFPEAEKVYDFILTQDPEFVSALTNKGFIALHSGNASKAKEFYDKALSLDPDDKQAMLNTAGWYIFEQKYSEAEEWLNKVLKKYPAEAQAQSLLHELKSMSSKKAG